jgi:hypothetical protein
MEVLGKQTSMPWSHRFCRARCIQDKCRARLVKNVLQEMKILFAVLSVICLGSQSCTIVDYKKSHDDVGKIKELVQVGDNIREARAILIKNNYKPSEIKKTTVTQDSYSFTVRLIEPTELDYVGYAAGRNLNPWRGGVRHWIAFKAGLDEVIFRIYTD